jgi:hypothetical protein
MNVAQNTAKTALNAIAALLNSGSLVFFAASAMPATPETALTSGYTALATFNFASAATGTDSYTSPDEQVTLAFSATQVTPSANGTALFARAFASGATLTSSPGVVDFTVGTSGSGADIILGTTGILTTVPMTLSSLALQLPSV